MAKNLKGLNKQLGSIAENFAKHKDRIEVAALQAGFVPMLERIFGQTRDGGGFAIDGSDLGEYSEYYRLVRFGERPYKNPKEYGKNYTKNLYFHGDLRNSIQQGIKGGRNVIGFTNKDEADIADYQEKQIGKDIFGFNEDEAFARDKVLNEEIKKLFEVSLKNV